jgi:uncharacterized protein YoaH (UPF0181 family)
LADAVEAAQTFTGQRLGVSEGEAIALGREKP